MMPLKRVLLLLLSTWQLSAFAETTPGTPPLDDRPWYRVEVVIFAQSNRLDALESERWPDEYVQAQLLPETEERFAEPPAESAKDVVVIRGLRVPPGADLANDTLSTNETMAEDGEPPLPDEFFWLEEPELQLSDAVSRLRSSNSMELLWHGGWVQPGLEREGAKPVPFRLPRSKPAVDEAGEPFPYTPPPLLEGQLRLVLARYLHLEANLGYLLPVDPQRIAESRQSEGVVEEQPTAVYGDETMSEEMTALALATLSEAEQETLLREAELSARPSWQVFRLQDSRRMRSGEVHYLDHPLFGIVVQALPLEMSPADAAAQAAMPAEEEVVTPATLLGPSQP